MTTARDILKAIEKIPEDFLDWEIVIDAGNKTEAFRKMPHNVKLVVNKEAVKDVTFDAVLSEIKDLENLCGELESENATLKKALKEAQEKAASLEIDLAVVTGVL